MRLPLQLSSFFSSTTDVFLPWNYCTAALSALSAPSQPSWDQFLMASQVLFRMSPSQIFFSANQSKVLINYILWDCPFITFGIVNIWFFLLNNLPFIHSFCYFFLLSTTLEFSHHGNLLPIWLFPCYIYSAQKRDLVNYKKFNNWREWIMRYMVVISDSERIKLRSL